MAPKKGGSEWRKLLISMVLFLSLTIGGGVLGFVVVSSSSRFQAKLSLPVSPFVYRSAEATISSISELRRFAEVFGLLETQEFKLLERQLREGGEVVKFTSEPRFRERDWKGVPDMLLNRLFDSNASSLEDRKVLNALVTATARESELAVRVVQFSMNYLRHLLFLDAVRKQLVQWGAQSRSELAANVENIASVESRLFKNEQELNATKDLRQKYKESRDSLALEAVPQSSVQVVAPPEFLSPERQVIALEVKRIRELAAIQDGRMQIAYLKYLMKIADEFLPKLEEGHSPQAIVAEIRKRVVAQEQLANEIDRLSVERARAAIDAALTSIEVRWIRGETEPNVPIAQPILTIPTPVGFMGGIVGGAVLWLAITMYHPIIRRAKRAVSRNVH